MLKHIGGLGLASKATYRLHLGIVLVIEYTRFVSQHWAHRRVWERTNFTESRDGICCESVLALGPRPHGRRTTREGPVTAVVASHAWHGDVPIELLGLLLPHIEHARFHLFKEFLLNLGPVVELLFEFFVQNFCHLIDQFLVVVVILVFRPIGHLLALS